ncbi:MAG: hypothetical protein IJV22_01165 [Bacteroidales bacterium]|nr:hypothetical protein [Bacteroidales bacterium]
MKHSIRQLEQGALQFAQQEISNLALRAKYIGTEGGTFYFEPQYKPSLESSTGNIHLVTFCRGQYGITFDCKEIESVNAELF